MSATSRVGTAIAAGYVLGRFKKMRLALIVGSAIAGKNLKSAGMDLVRGSSGDGKSSPLVSAGRSALVAAASSSMDRISDRLHERSAALGGDDSDQDEDNEPQGEEEEPLDEDEEEEPLDEDEDEEPVDEDEEQDDSGGRSARRRRATAPGRS